MITSFAGGNFRNSPTVSEAQRLDIPGLLSTALGMREILGFLNVRGFDEAAL